MAGGWGLPIEERVNSQNKDRKTILGFKERIPYFVAVFFVSSSNVLLLNTITTASATATKIIITAINIL